MGSLIEGVGKTNRAVVTASMPRGLQSPQKTATTNTRPTDNSGLFPKFTNMVQHWVNGSDSPSQTATSTTGSWGISAGLQRLIKKFECGNRDVPPLEAYQCPAGVWTIGFGNTENVKPGQKITMDQACAKLRQQVSQFAGYVKHYVGDAQYAQLTQNQKDALTSLVLNIGPGNFAKSEVLAQIKAGNMDAAAQAFMKHTYIKGNPNPLAGLVKRRKEEAELFLT